VTVQYEDGSPKRIGTVIVSTQHAADIQTDELRDVDRWRT
jgi:S-adenosylmethionine synthetase